MKELFSVDLIILYFLFIFAIFTIYFSYKYIINFRLKKGIKRFHLPRLDNLILIVIGLFVTLIIFHLFYYHNFNSFTIEIENNIKDVDFVKLYDDIYKKSKANKEILVYENSGPEVLIDYDGNILSMKFSFIYQEDNKYFIYHGKYEDNILKFKKDSTATYYNPNHLLIDYFNQLNQISYSELIVLSEQLEEELNQDLVNDGLYLKYEYNYLPIQLNSRFYLSYDENIYFVDDNGGINETIPANLIGPICKLTVFVQDQTTYEEIPLNFKLLVIYSNVNLSNVFSLIQ